MGSDVRSRSAAKSIITAITSPNPPECLSFAGVNFISRSFTDELCVIISQFPTLRVVDMDDGVKNMYQAVLAGRSVRRVRPTEDAVIKSFDNIKELSAFMRNT